VRNKTEAKVLANFLYNEGIRHTKDIRQIVVDLHNLESKWNVRPSGKIEFVET
jgi:hypothetical protein